MDLNYFVCTLGQAALPGVSRPFRDVNHLIDQQASQTPDSPAVGFYQPNDQNGSYQTQILTFKKVLQGVLTMADTISTSLTLQSGQIVGLLCNSSPAFLFTWLGLIRSGHPVLLIAPQCSPSAIAHLSKACEASVVFHDEAHEKLAHEAAKFAAHADLLEMKSQRLPFENDEDVFRMIRRQPKNGSQPYEISGADIAYLHHTSGTSSGMPKPIPHTHRGGVGVLPALDGSSAATFTTTPLYHGGVADLFRAWSSAALIWLFPSHHVPITATQIVKCLDASTVAARGQQTPSVKYFSSVPYVLQMMARDANGLKHLQGMDIVGVGGAALPPEVGDSLVRKGVNLVSRYGSAECGFLMSSHRDYENDKEWQFLRRPSQVTQLKFEGHENGQSELVVLPGWPHMAKTNREDGSFATFDLFAPHPTIKNAWRYHSRADSQLALITGKKFDPAPLEGIIVASSPMISEVLIFGNGKPYPGAFIFRSIEGKDMLDDELVQEVAPIVEQLNRESQAHARIPRNMLIPVACEPSPLEKSSKGTILRSRAEDKFQDQIENAYNRTTFTEKDIDDKDLSDAISRIVENFVGTSQIGDDERLTAETDLFSYGVDSVACVQIRHALTQLLPEDAEALPLTIVEDSGNVSHLAEVVVKYRKGEKATQPESYRELLREYVDRYSTFVDDEHGGTLSEADSYNVLLTGPTGLLGAHILSQLLSDARVDKIYLLVRGASSHAAKERVLKSLESRHLLKPSDFDEKVHVMPCKLSDSGLGLSEDDYQTLTDNVDKIFHLAWSVNFLVSLRSLGTTHLSGLQNLLNLALKCKRQPRFLFCSSVASVTNLLNGDKVPETIVDDTSACGSTGYAQSKLVAELICSKCANTTQMKGRISVIRVGQLSGATTTGVWNMTEAYPLMLASSKTTGVLPDLENEALSWLPVDVAARCFVEAAFNHNNTATSTSTNGAGNDKSVQVLHLLNTTKTTQFRDLIKCLKHAGEAIEAVPVDKWLEKLAELQNDEKTKDHPALKLFPFWQTVYSSNAKSRSERAEVDRKPTDGTDVVDDGDGYETALSRRAMPSLAGAIGPLREEYLLRLWEWIKSNGA